MTLVRVEIRRLPRTENPYRWEVACWNQFDPDVLPMVESGEHYETAKDARRRARELRRGIRSGNFFECGCGEIGTYEEMFEDSGLELSCGGSGFLNCYCAGDFCACHNHGEMECPGCEECDHDPDSDFGDPEEMGP